MTERENTDSAREALDEAVLLMIRKLNRLHPMAMADTLARLGKGAQSALNQAEMRADLRREAHGPLTEWPVEWPELDLDAA